MGKKKSKGSGKKQERLEREALRRRTLERLQGPNGLEDCGASALAPALLEYDGCGVSFAASGALGADARDEIFALLSGNMRAQYEASDWGWDAKEKRGELGDGGARFAVARDAATGALAAFVHFRFEPDDDDEPKRAALYVREIQVAASARGKGLGKRLMSLLHIVAAGLDLDCVMLTVFKANAGAKRFYLDKLKYAVDADDPANFGDDAACYTILSRPLPRRPALAPTN